MPDLIIMRGLPASGKTTLAEQYLSKTDVSAVRVNRDGLRRALFFKDGGQTTHAEENFVTEVQHRTIREALQAGKNVVVDDMNLRPKYCRALNALALSVNARTVTLDVPIDLATALERDQEREHEVGEHAIRVLWSKFIGEDGLPRLPFEPLQPEDMPPNLPATLVEHDSALPDCYIVDIDGTMAVMHDRSPFDWDKVGNDTQNKAVVDLVGGLFHASTWTDPDVEVFFFSGRDVVCRKDTEKWIRDAVGAFPKDEIRLHMRPEGDNRDDREVKQEMYEREIKGQYNVRFILDDRDKVVAHWRSLGLPCFQVQPGPF